MKISFRNILRHILAGLCAVVFVVAAYVGGYFITFGDSSAFLAVFIACAAALAVWLIANIAVAAGQNKKYGGMNARQVYDYSVKVQRETEEDYSRAERGVLYSLLAVRLSAAGLLALLLIACLAAGAGAAYDYLNTVPGIVAALISYGVFAALFAPLAASGSDRASLGAKDYPLIFQTVERAAQKTGCKRPYTVCLGMGPTGISEGNGRIYLELNAIECAMLTSEELYSVMLHEFAHAVNADTGRTGRLSRARLRWGDDNAVCTAFLSAAIQSFMLRSMMYEAVATRHHEQLADDMVKAAGAEQLFIDATAKVTMYALFQEMPVRELSFDIFEGEKMPHDIYSRALKVFLSYREGMLGKWEQVLANELPARIASHPTLRQRMEAMGVSGYDVSAAESEPGYIAETEKLLACADGQACIYMAKEYPALREANYVKRKAEMDKYAAAKAADKTLSAEQLIGCMEAYYGVDNAVAIEIADKLLASECNHTYAHMLKGRIYFDDFDGRCVEHFRAAMALDPSVSADCLDYIGRFALLSGDEELLGEYRSSGPEQLMAAEERADSEAWRPGTELRATALAQDVLEELSARMREHGKGRIEAAYAADYGSGNTLIVVRFRKLSPAGVRREVLGELYGCIAALSPDYALAEYSPRLAGGLNGAGIAPFYRQEK